MRQNNCENKKQNLYDRVNITIGTLNIIISIGVILIGLFVVTSVCNGVI